MKRIALVFVCCLFLGLGSAWGDNFFCCSTDLIDWYQNYGAPFNVLSSPQAWASFGGLTGFVGVVGGGSFERLDQGNGWNGNFEPGSDLIWNQGSGDFGIWFNEPVGSVGMAVQADLFGPFTATLYAYSGNTLLGTSVMYGVSNSNADGSATFISYTTMSPFSDITYVQIGVVDWQGGSGFAPCDVVTSLKPHPTGPSEPHPCTATSPTPEPGSLPLLGTGVIGALWTIRRRLL